MEGACHRGNDGGRLRGGVSSMSSRCFKGKRVLERFGISIKGKE